MSRWSAAAWKPSASWCVKLEVLWRTMRAGWCLWVLRYSARASISRRSGVGLSEVGLAVGLGDLCGAAAHDDAVAALVEDLRDSRVQLLAVGGAVETDADVAGRQVRAVTLHAPGRAAGLVVQGGVKVPRPGGLVLQRPGRLPVLGRSPGPGLLAHQLQRRSQRESGGFE